jgi:exodeoxyribonuclease VII large subunit
MHGRHASELGHHLRRAVLDALAHRGRSYRDLRARLAAGDLRHRMAVRRGQLQRADARLDAAVQRGRERADARFRVLAGRLENLSPLAVLARGYAVCWNDRRTSVIRQAGQAAPGTRVLVTLAEGELDCQVIGSVARRRDER